MKAKRNPAGWPDNLPQCARCGTANGSGAYGARGLCKRCYMAMVRAGRIQFWFVPAAEPVQVDQEERARLAAEHRANPTRRLVRLVGASYAAIVCGVDVASVRQWFEDGTPAHACETVETELQRVRRERARRAVCWVGSRDES